MQGAPQSLLKAFGHANVQSQQAAARCLQFAPVAIEVSAIAVSNSEATSDGCRFVQPANAIAQARQEGGP